MFNQIEREAAMAVFWLRVMTSTATVVKTLRLVCHRIRVVLHWWLWRSNAMPDDMERGVTSGEKQFALAVLAVSVLSGANVQAQSKSPITGVWRTEEIVVTGGKNRRESSKWTAILSGSRIHSTT